MSGTRKSPHLQPLVQQQRAAPGGTVAAQSRHELVQLAVVQRGRADQPSRRRQVDRHIRVQQRLQLGWQQGRWHRGRQGCAGSWPVNAGRQRLGAGRQSSIGGEGKGNLRAAAEAVWGVGRLKTTGGRRSGVRMPVITTVGLQAIWTPTRLAFRKVCKVIYNVSVRGGSTAAVAATDGANTKRVAGTAPCDSTVQKRRCQVARRSEWKAFAKSKATRLPVQCACRCTALHRALCPCATHLVEG